MILDSRQLEYFLAVVRLGSLGRAAESLSTTQPTLGRSIKNLERRLGVSLFDRHAMGMQLTSYGKALLPYAEVLENEGQRAVDEIESLRRSGKGVIRLGVGPSLAHLLMPLAIQRMLARHPALRFDIAEGLGQSLTSALSRGDIDLAISGEIESREDKDITSSIFFQDNVVVVARATHPLLHGASEPQLRDLLEFPWILSSQSKLWSELQKLFRREGLTPPTLTVEANSAHIMKAMIGESDFLSFLPRNLISLEEKLGLLSTIPVAGASWSRDLYVLRRRRTTIPHATAEFLAELRNSLNDISA